MFLQHALSCHVCHRSLLFIPMVKTVRYCHDQSQSEQRVERSFVTILCRD